MNTEWHNWMREGIKVFYKDVDITDKIGLCICRHCTQSIKDEIDRELKKMNKN